MARYHLMEAMELDIKPPPQVTCTDDQLVQLDGVRRRFAHVAAQTAEIGAFFDEIIAVIDALAAQVRELRRLRAEGLCAGLGGPLREVEWAFGRVSAVARRVGALRGTVVEMGRSGVGLGCGGEAADELAAALQRMHVDLSQ